MHPGRLVYCSMRMATVASSIPRPAPEAEEVYRRWIHFLDEEFTRHHSPERRAEIVRDQLYQLYLGRPHRGELDLTLTSELPGDTLSLSLAPENVTLEAEHYADVEAGGVCQTQAIAVVLADVRPFAGGYQPLAGSALQVHAGTPYFWRMGQGVKIDHGVDLTYGYNLTIEDGATIRQRVLLNDRGGIVIGKGAVIGSFARVYSHTYGPDNFDRVALVPTIIGAGARIASHAIVLAGQHVAAGQVVGSFPSGNV